MTQQTPEAKRLFKDAAYEQLARVGKALGSPARLELLDLLCQGPKTVEVLATEAGQKIANTSHHLQILRGARLVETRKEGIYVQYRLAGDDVCTLYRSLRRLAEARLAEIERLTRDFAQARGELESVDTETLVERICRGEVTVIDVRPHDEYRAGHLPGAISLPLDELEHRLADLPTERDIVAYCRGPYCVLALDAVIRLRNGGLRAHRLEEGVPDWRARGLEVAVEEEK